MSSAMNIEDLTAIFVEELGGKSDGDTVSLADNGTKVTLLVATTDGVMSVPKVRSIRATERYLAVATETGHTFVARNTVFGVRSEDEGTRGSSRPGFS